MGYGRFMGYAMHFPAHQLGGHKMLWDKRGYGFIEVWVKRGLTVHPNHANHTIEGIIQTKRYNSIDMYPSYNMRVNLKDLSEIWQQGKGIGGG